MHGLLHKIAFNDSRQASELHFINVANEKSQFKTWECCCCWKCCDCCCCCILCRICCCCCSACSCNCCCICAWSHGSESEIIFTTWSRFATWWCHWNLHEYHLGKQGSSAGAHFMKAVPFRWPGLFQRTCWCWWCCFKVDWDTAVGCCCGLWSCPVCWGDCWGPLTSEDCAESCSDSRLSGESSRCSCPCLSLETVNEDGKEAPVSGCKPRSWAFSGVWAPKLRECLIVYGGDWDCCCSQSRFSSDQVG